MSNPIYFAPLRVPLVDLQTGIISREWQLLLQAMFNRIGGANGLSITEVLALLASGVQDAGQTPPVIPGIAPDDQSPPMIPDATFDDLLGELRQTRDVVAELAKSLQGLQQGTISI
jgi:hypothetical protein